MSDAVEVLEALGRDARFHTGSGDAVADELAAREVDAQIQAAIHAVARGEDPHALHALLGLTPMAALIMPAEEEEEGEGEREPEDVPRPETPPAAVRSPDLPGPLQ
ncbi:hypothetical protein [Dyella sp.]|jgi:hypothetical protein|uniref:hypothetical protein n=1 Tax=Dyella sp. TaxID=1869338 RepID=UPI002D779D19|nr:hypothetical protein [Dyella sp.]HET6432486.1 hypothetical protein [Dyella sp.]